MVKNFRPYIASLPIVFRIVTHFIISRRKAKQFAQTTIAQIEKNYCHTVSEKVRKKTITSFAIYNPIVCDAFTQLHKRFTSKEEQKLLVYYFVMASMYDDFFDHHEMSVETIEKLTFLGDAYMPKTLDEMLIQSIHRYLLARVNNKTDYLSLFEHMFTAQKDSLLQFNADIDTETLLSITHRKGGYAVLMCYYYLQVVGSEAEKKCWYLLGTIIQMINDLFDTFKDSRAGIYTFANHSNSVTDIKTAYNNQVQLLKHAIREVKANPRNKRFFNYTLAAVYCLGFLAIEQLEKVAEKYGKKLPNFTELSRKDLVIDMELYKNRKRWISLFMLEGYSLN